MNCNEVIQNYIVENDECIICPFCEKQLDKLSTKKDVCCVECQIINDNNGENVCIQCGVVDGYSQANEYIDFYENLYKIKRKSVYHRKYHIKNKLNTISSKYSFKFSHNDCYKMIKVFDEINRILPEINYDRKRIININFILKILFTMMKIPIADKIPISSSKKTYMLIRDIGTKLHH